MPPRSPNPSPRSVNRPRSSSAGRGVSDTGEHGHRLVGGGRASRSRLRRPAHSHHTATSPIACPLKEAHSVAVQRPSRAAAGIQSHTTPGMATRLGIRPEGSLRALVLASSAGVFRLCVGSVADSVEPASSASTERMPPRWGSRVPGLQDERRDPLTDVVTTTVQSRWSLCETDVDSVQSIKRPTGYAVFEVTPVQSIARRLQQTATDHPKTTCGCKAQVRRRERCR
jgi:hypothetical protein